MVRARMQGGLLGAIGLSFLSCGLAQALGSLPFLTQLIGRFIPDSCAVCISFLYALLSEDTTLWWL